MAKKRGRCKHEFIAVPITGLNAATGKEDLLGFKIVCSKCGKTGDDPSKVVEITSSWWEQVIPKPIKLKNGLKPEHIKEILKRVNIK